MKKLITAIIGTVLAGTMAVGLAACNTGDSDPALVKAIKATVAAENYKTEVSMDMGTTWLLNGELLKNDDTIGETGMTGLEFLQFYTGKEEPENPAYTSMGKALYSYDFTNGKVCISDIEEEDGETESSNTYYEVDGTSINLYYLDGAEDYPVMESYTGYASNKEAKNVLKSCFENTEGLPTLADVLEAEMTGTGDNASKSGTISQIYDIFEYDKTSKTYSATVNVAELGNEENADVRISFTVESGKVTLFELSVVASSVEFPAIEGMSYEISMVISMGYSDFGATTVTVPAEYKEVEEENITVTPVINSQEAWQELFADYNQTEFCIYYYTKADEGSGYIETEIYVDTSTNRAYLKTTDRDNHNYTGKYYKVENGTLKTYTATFSYSGSFQAWLDPVETPLAGNADATAALIAALPQQAQDYYAGFSAGSSVKPISELFSEFKHFSLTAFAADLKMNGKAVEVKFYYEYDEEDGYSLNGFNVFYSDDEYFTVYPEATDELDRRNPVF